MGSPVIQFKRGIFSNLPGLRIGEPGFTTDKYDLYVGVNSTTEGNKFFGSHRYWTKETLTTGSGINLVEGTNNGENAITLKAPASIGSDVTYTFPGAAVDQGYLRTNSSGTFTWESGVNASGVSTIAFLQATTVNVSAAATIPTLTGTTATFTNITANAGFTGNINAAGVSTVSALQATTVNSSGIVTASSLRAADLRTTGGALIPLVGIQSAVAATGLVTAFKFVGTGLDGFIVDNNVATISYSGVAATTYTTSQTVVATQGQTSFTFNAGYIEGFIDTYLNGIRLITGTDYTANDGATISLTSGATAGDELEMVAWKSLGDVVNVNTLRTAGSINVSGVVTARSFDGALNFTGVSTAGQVLVTTVNATGIITASSFSGSGSGLSAGTVPISALDIDGGTAATAITSDDLFIIDDGANGTNKKVTAQIISNYILGGSGGATFPAINVTGIGTVEQLQATTATVGAGLTVTGDADLNGNLDVDGFAELDDANVSGTLNVVGFSTFTGAIDANGGVNISGSATIDQLTVSGVTTSTGGFVGNLTGNSNTSTALETARNFQVTGDAASAVVSFNGTTNVGLAITFATVNNNTGSFGSQTEIPVITVNAKGLVTAVTTASVGTALTVTGDSGSEQIDLLSETLSISGGSNVTTSASSNGVTVNLDNDISLTSVVASGIITATSGFSGNLTGNVTGNISGNLNSVGVSTISFLKATTATVGAGLTVTGTTDLNGGLDVSGGETVLSSATISDLTSGRVVLAGTSGAIVDSGNLIFDVNGLSVAGGANVSAASTFGSDLAVGGNVIVSGDLTVNGTTTQINTVQMTVEDTLIELQIINGSVPGSDTNKDVGIVMNYFNASAKKAAFYWDDSVSRMVAASEISESSGVLTASTFAGLEIGSLYVNDCAGASQVISCSGTTRSLENITIDGGVF